ncbi:MAG: protein kinase, partial [Sandaracinaceae bacterium]
MSERLDAILTTLRSTLERAPLAGGTVDEQSRQTIWDEGDPDALDAALAGLEPDAPPVELGPEIRATSDGARICVATQIRLRRRVVVRTCDPSDSALASVIRHEARVTAQLEHPNVVPVYDLVDVDGAPLVALEHVDGLSWWALIKNERLVTETFSVESALDWHLEVLLAVCNAVRFAHSRGIVVRDLPPDAVLIGTHGEVLVTRLRAACEASEVTGEIVGSPPFMAPEQLVPERRGSPIATDVYVLGGLLACVVNGAPPHAGQTLREVVTSVAGGGPDFDASAPEELVRIARRAMHPEPAKRFGSVDELAEAIRLFRRHRDAIELVTSAARLLEPVEAWMLSDDEATRAALYRTVGEARFGFRQALELWPESAQARAGFDRATIALIEHELGRGEPEAARGQLTELHDPPVALAARVERACEERSRERDALERLARDRDPGVERSFRRVLATGIALAFAIFPVLGHALESERTHRMMILGTCAALVGLWVVTFSFRRAVLERAVTRWIAAGLNIGLVGQMMLSGLALSAGRSVEETEALHLALYCAVAGMNAIGIERRMWVSALGYAVGVLVAIWIPSHAWIIKASCHVVTLINVAWIWRAPSTRDDQSARDRKSV